MEIKDLTGKAIQVTDLDLAILQGDDYRHYRRTNPADAKQDAALQAYWQDIYEKLLKLRSYKNAPPCHLLLSSATGSAACWVA